MIMTDLPQRSASPTSPRKIEKKIGWVALNYLDLRYGKPAIIEAKYKQNPFEWLRKQQGEVAVKFVKTDLNDSFPF